MVCVCLFLGTNELFLQCVYVCFWELMSYSYGVFMFAFGLHLFCFSFYFYIRVKRSSTPYYSLYCLVVTYSSLLSMVIAPLKAYDMLTW
jgi:hypothetical protein